jgi:hypothetical protein
MDSCGRRGGAGQRRPGRRVGAPPLRCEYAARAAQACRGGPEARSRADPCAARLPPVAGVSGTIGHVAHGKSTVVKAITGVQTVRFKNELERNITIKLG